MLRAARTISAAPRTLDAPSRIGTIGSVREVGGVAQDLLGCGILPFMPSPHWELLASAVPAALSGVIPFLPGRRVRAHLVRSKYEVLERGVFVHAHRRGPVWFVAARPDGHSRMRPGSAVWGVLVRNSGRAPVGISRITMVLEPPEPTARPGSSPLRQSPRWVSGAVLPCTLGASSVDFWSVPTSEIVAPGPRHHVRFEVGLDTGNELRTERAEVWWS